MINKKISPESQNITIQELTKRITSGFELQEKEIDFLTEEEIIKYNDSIIIAPDYQRDYRSSVEDESSLIESVLLGIPIPPVFLVHKKEHDLQLMNVVDGQHRLRAFYRFVNDKFKLKGLTILKYYNDKSFKQLELNIRLEINSTSLSAIVFKNFPEKEFELEIFRRYNKGTKPLSAQEIRHAVYNSKINTLVNDFSSKLFKNKNSKLSIAYNVTKDKLQKKKLQESIFVILSILENGINDKLQKSPHYAESFMKEKSELEKNESYKFSINYDYLKKTFEEFNKFIELISYKIEYPFSKEIYGVSKRNYKFQISIAMILSAVYKKMKDDSSHILIDIMDGNCNDFLNRFSLLLNNSYLEDPEYNASSTSPVMLKELICSFDIRTR